MSEVPLQVPYGRGTPVKFLMGELPPEGLQPHAERHKGRRGGGEGAHLGRHVREHRARVLHDGHGLLVGLDVVLDVHGLQLLGRREVVNLVEGGGFRVLFFLPVRF